MRIAGVGALEKALILTATLGLVGSALAVPAQVVFTIAGVNPGHPKAAVPGYPGAQFTNIGAVYRSHTTNLWIAVPTTDMAPTTQDQVLVIGNGATFNAVAREGVTEFAPGEFLDFSTGIPVPRINDSGQWAMGFKPAANPTGDERVVKWDGTAFSVIARSNTPSPFFSGTNWLAGFNSAAITNAGVVSFIGGINDLTVTKGVFGGSGTTIVAGLGQTVPTNQAGGGTATLDLIDNGSFSTKADGSSSIYTGRVLGGTKVAVVDGAVVLQVGVPAADFTSPISTISEVIMESNGDWYARGSNADGQGWAIRKGQRIAATGSPIFIGATETWSAISDIKGNNKGDFAILGTVTGATTQLSQAIVLNGRKLIHRKSDGVDLNGDGIINDGLYTNNLRAGRCFLGNDGWYYIGSALKATPDTTTSISANAAFIRIDATYCVADLDNGTGSGAIDNAVDVNDLLFFLGAFEAGSSSVDIDDGTSTGTRDGGVDINDLLYFLAHFEAGC